MTYSEEIGGSVKVKGWLSFVVCVHSYFSWLKIKGKQHRVLDLQYFDGLLIHTLNCFRILFGPQGLRPHGSGKNPKRNSLSMTYLALEL